MPYRIKLGERLIEADTPDEVCELLKRLETDGAGAIVEAPQRHVFDRWTLMGVALFMEIIENRPDQRNLIVRLYSQQAWRKESLVAASKISAQQLGGVLAGIAKNAKKIGRPPVVKVEHIQLAGRRTCVYRLDDTFRQFLARELQPETNRAAQHGSADARPIGSGASTPQVTHGAPVPPHSR